MTITRKFKLFILRQALLKATSKLCPRRIPRTGDRAKKIDCFYAEIRHLADKIPDFLVDRVVNQEIHCRLWDGEKFNENRTIPIAELENYEFHATHYLGLATFYYASPLELTIWEILKIPKLLIVRDQIRQWWFNSKTPQRTSLNELLKKLVDLRLKQEASNEQEFGFSDGIDNYNLLIEIHGERIFSHPEFETINAEQQLMLESLVDSDDLRESRHKFRATGKSLTTIAQYEQEDRRHREQMQHNIWIRRLTWVLVVIGVVQAYSAWAAIN